MATARTSSPYSKAPLEDLNNYTQIVHSMFGESVGTCYGSFSCGCNRQQGRLYVACKAIMFYSNLFGFERRLCMYHSEVTEIKIHRATSIWVSTMDGEDFVFKSFTDRERVIALIQRLMTTAQSSSSPQEENIPDADELEFCSMIEESIQQELTNKGVVDEPSTSLEDKSSEITKAEACLIEKIAADQFPSDDNGVQSSTLYPGRRSFTTDSNENLLDAWKKEKESKRKDEEVIVEGCMLDCTLAEFFDMFLADDAPHSVANFQESEIGDTELEVTKWTIDDSDHPSTMTRVISFCHPISNKLGFGPSSTMAIRKQTLHRHGNLGICMYATTNIKDVPASNAFYVSERWLIESVSDDDSRTCLTVLNKIVFTKRSFLKQVIISSTKDEVKGWYKRYVTMLSSHVRGTTTTTQQVEKSTELPETRTTILRSITGIIDLNSMWILLSFSLLLAVLLQNYLLRQQVQVVGRKMSALQQEQDTILKFLKTIQQLVTER